MQGKGPPEGVYGGLDADDVELSPAATVLAFSSLLPPLRVPVRAAAADNPEAGEFLLAFPDEAAWRRSWAACERSLQRECEAGAQVGCSVAASAKCRPSWWDSFTARTRQQKEELAERREACEQAEMMACRTAATEKCQTAAAERCLPAFSDVYISKDIEFVHPRFLDRRSLRILALRRERESQSAAANASGASAQANKGGSGTGPSLPLPREASGMEEAAAGPAGYVPEKSPGRRLTMQQAQAKAAALLQDAANEATRKGPDTPPLSHVRHTQELAEKIVARGRKETGAALAPPIGQPVQPVNPIAGEGVGWEGGLIKPKVKGPAKAGSGTSLWGWGK